MMRGVSLILREASTEAAPTEAVGAEGGRGDPCGRRGPPDAPLSPAFWGRAASNAGCEAAQRPSAGPGGGPPPAAAPLCSSPAPGGRRPHDGESTNLRPSSTPHPPPPAFLLLLLLRRGGKREEGDEGEEEEARPRPPAAAAHLHVAALVLEALDAVVLQPGGGVVGHGGSL